MLFWSLYVCFVALSVLCCCLSVNLSIDRFETTKLSKTGRISFLAIVFKSKTLSFSTPLPTGISSMCVTLNEKGDLYQNSTDEFLNVDLLHNNTVSEGELKMPLQSFDCHENGDYSKTLSGHSQLRFNLNLMGNSPYMINTKNESWILTLCYVKIPWLSILRCVKKGCVKSEYF